MKRDSEPLEQQNAKRFKSNMDLPEDVISRLNTKWSLLVPPADRALKIASLHSILLRFASALTGSSAAERFCDPTDVTEIADSMDEKTIDKIIQYWNEKQWQCILEISVSFPFLQTQLFPY